MHKFFSIVTYVFMAFYAFALFMMLSSTFGLFGVEQDPMSGIFLILLGQPWVSRARRARQAVHQRTVGYLKTPKRSQMHQYTQTTTIGRRSRRASIPRSAQRRMCASSRLRR